MTTKCRTLYLPSDPAFMAAACGALLELTYPYNWEKFGTLTPDEMAQAFIEVYGDFADSECIEVANFPYPKIVNITLSQFTLLQGTTFTRTVSSTQLYNGGIEILPSAINNAVRCAVWCEQGVYDVAVLGMENTGYGIVTCQAIGGSLAPTKDWYAAAATFNVLQTYQIDIPTRGLNYIDFRVLSKREASGGYRFIFSDIAMTWLYA